MTGGVDVPKVARLGLPGGHHDPSVGERRALDRERLRSESGRQNAIGSQPDRPRRGVIRSHGDDSVGLVAGLARSLVAARVGAFEHRCLGFGAVVDAQSVTGTEQAPRRPDSHVPKSD